MSVPVATELVPIQGALAQVAFRRSARARKISLRIDPAQGGVVITLPQRASRRAGLALLQMHEAWVAERLASLPNALPFVPGALVPVRGEPHVICPAPSGRGGAWIEDGRILVTGQPGISRPPRGRLPEASGPPGADRAGRRQGPAGRAQPQMRAHQGHAHALGILRAGRHPRLLLAADSARRISCRIMWSATRSRICGT